MRNKYIETIFLKFNFPKAQIFLGDSGAYIVGILIAIFWLTILSQIGILSIIDTFGAFFGPLFGVMVVDFYFIKKGSLINKDIHSLEANGAYFFSGGWHIKGIYSLILGFIFSILILFLYLVIFNKSFSEISLRSISFNVISILTGTGYVTQNFDSWGNFPLIYFLMLMFIGGCAGSTTCGIKIFRIQILYSFIQNHLLNSFKHRFK